MGSHFGAAAPFHRRRERELEQVDDALYRPPQRDHLALRLEQVLVDLLGRSGRGWRREIGGQGRRRRAWLWLGSEREEGGRACSRLIEADRDAKGRPCVSRTGRCRTSYSGSLRVLHVSAIFSGTVIKGL